MTLSSSTKTQTVCIVKNKNPHNSPSPYYSLLLSTAMSYANAQAMCCTQLKCCSNISLVRSDICWWIIVDDIRLCPSMRSLHQVLGCSPICLYHANFLTMINSLILCHPMGIIAIALIFVVWCACRRPELVTWLRLWDESVFIITSCITFVTISQRYS